MVPDGILNKPGPLTDVEFEEMKKHPAHGRDVIVKAEQQVVFTMMSFSRCRTSCTHHEWWNGRLSAGLQGEQIPIAGRIVALVDA